VILVLPEGVADAVRNGITTQDEVSRHFGDKTSPATKKKNLFYVKKIQDIEYRIYTYWKEWKVKELVLDVVKEMGFSTNLSVPWHLVNEALGTAFKEHRHHWTAEMEELGSSIKYHEKELDYMYIFLKRLKRKGVVLPLVNSDGDVTFAIRNVAFTPFSASRDTVLIDAKKKMFRTKTLYDGFSFNELRSALTFDKSLCDTFQEQRTFQYPIRWGIRLLQKVPEEYHETIRTYLRGYQRMIKKRLPKSIIVLCPHLQELVEQKI
jgi:hypothetical protein